MSPLLQKQPEQTKTTDFQQVKVGLKTFFRITDEWGLSREERLKLLGQPGKTLYSEWKAGNVKPRAASTDLLDRLSYVLGIYNALNIMHSKENQLNFLKNPTEATPFMSKSPLEYMMSGHLVALSDVRRYLDFHRGM